MKKIAGTIDRSIEILIVVVFFAMVAVGGAQIFNRFVLNVSISWSEEFQRYGQVWLVFLGIPVAYRRGMHIGMQTVETLLPLKGQRIFHILIDILWALLGAAILIGIYKLSSFLSVQRSSGLGIPMTWAYFGMVLGSGYMIFVAIRRLAAQFLPPSKDEAAKKE